MTGAMYAAIAGLKTHMSKLNVIGNNIANVNTYGYKSQRVTFQDSLYTTTRSGSNGTATVGGRNPSQVGYGAQIRSIDLNMSNGEYAPTGWGLDCMIDGSGFFLVSEQKDLTFSTTDPESLKSLQLSRAGDFYFGPDGYLTDGGGHVVYGFLNAVATADGTTPAISSTLAPIRLPLANADGTPRYPFPNDTPADATKPELEDNPIDPDNPDNSVRVKLDTISIDEQTGKITGFVEGSDTPVTIGYIPLASVDNPNGVSHISGTYYRCGEGAGSLQITSIGGALADLGITQVGAALHAAVDVPGLRVGDTSAKLRTGGLELSKADLATEITEMITTQRGYQANTRIITVTDSMLEELVNMKR